MEEKIAEIISTFHQKGCRMTDQRKKLLSLIVKNPDCSCKELYYLARTVDNSIGRATVYRTVRTLEDFGFIQVRKISLV